MYVEKTSFDDKIATALWEENMHESWDAYKGSDMFVVIHDGDIVAGFSVYRDESEGVSGIFCSGWVKRHTPVPTEQILKQLSYNVGDIYFKTDQRAAKFLLEKIAERVKKTDGFVYYVIRGSKNGKTKES